MQQPRHSPRRRHASELEALAAQPALRGHTCRTRVHATKKQDIHDQRIEVRPHDRIRTNYDIKRAKYDIRRAAHGYPDLLPTLLVTDARTALLLPHHATGGGGGAAQPAGWAHRGATCTARCACRASPAAPVPTAASAQAGGAAAPRGRTPGLLPLRLQTRSAHASPSHALKLQGEVLLRQRELQWREGPRALRHVRRGILTWLHNSKRTSPLIRLTAPRAHKL